MNRIGIIIAAVIVLVPFASVALGLRLYPASLLFGILALMLAPLAIHKVPSPNWSAGLLVGLAFFASFPVKKLEIVGGPVQEVLCTLAYGAVLWLVGLGWKRKWS
ncbi:hypothetical protein [Poseidonocella sedimentorum]|uniref:Uncharacterized protein n=1 Tax=Poseidonocella sedimentorum TaxID=871652 RepID=A0A1I6EHZ0_9RHOB|nr:hypothetical protein [Poseidonocella sedimentorum]SFR17363.1 hypothetical protein SAMN04515673_11259 [Poseidonocella sedimentorum]